MQRAGGSACSKIRAARRAPFLAPVNTRVLSRRGIPGGGEVKRRGEAQIVS